ncbi:MAG: flavodoxin family protein [Solobacterium sp.]|nr:flavodoxin family protein [Solobacterium sp.]
MKVIVTDTGIFPGRKNEEDIVIRNNMDIRPCVGCFSCWTKTPGACIHDDELYDIGLRLARCTELVIVSKCLYGGVSPFVKRVIERFLPYMHPDFTVRNGMMRHKRRYPHTFEISAYFYGEEISDEEKRSASDLVKANAVNLYASVKDIVFVKEAWQIGGMS